MYKKPSLIFMMGLWLFGILVSCSPSQADYDARATVIADEFFSTQTAETPVQTPATTFTPTHTPTPSPSPLPPTDTPPPMPENQIAYLTYEYVTHRYRTRSGPMIYLMNPDGTNQRPLIDNPPLNDVEEFAWSPDGRQIAFASDDPAMADIFIINANGTDLGVIAFTYKNDEDDRYPTWSPNGLWIAYVSGYGNLYLADIERGTSERILETYKYNPTFNFTAPYAVDIRHLAWSPDSTRLGFSAGDVDHDNYQINLQAGTASTISANPFLPDHFPTWSPDGDYVAYTTKENHASRFDLYLIASTGNRNPVRMTNHNSTFPIQPVWSPDSKRILYAVSIGNSKWDIYVIDVDGGNQRRLTGDPSRDDQKAEGHYNKYPDWSPDGEFIVFQSNRDSDVISFPQIYIMNADGSNQTNLTNNDQASHFLPAWQP